MSCNLSIGKSIGKCCGHLSERLWGPLVETLSKEMCCSDFSGSLQFKKISILIFHVLFNPPTRHFSLDVDGNAADSLQACLLLKTRRGRERWRYYWWWIMATAQETRLMMLLRELDAVIMKSTTTNTTVVSQAKWHTSPNTFKRARELNTKHWGGVSTSRWQTATESCYEDSHIGCVYPHQLSSRCYVVVS